MSPVTLTPNRSGISLIELLVAVVVLVGTVTSLSLLIPKMSRNRVATRFHSVGANLALSKLQELKGNPYPLIQADLTGPWVTSTAQPCECKTADFTQMPNGDQDTIIVDGNRFNRSWCVNQVKNVGGVWNSFCPSVDTGYKSITVWVAWGIGASRQFTEANGTVTRL